MFIFGGCYTSNERYNDTYYLKLRNYPFIQPHSNGPNHPTRNLLALPKMQCPKLEALNQEHITQWLITKIRSWFLVGTEVLTIKEHHSTTSMNWTLTLSNGVSLRQKEIPPSQEVDTLLVWLLKKINFWSLEAGISFFNSIISSFMILKLKLGQTLNSIIKLQNGTLEES